MSNQRPRLIIPVLQTQEPSLKSAYFMHKTHLPLPFPTPTSAPIQTDTRTQKKQLSIILPNTSITTVNMSRFVAYLFRNIISNVSLNHSTKSHMLLNFPPGHIDSLFKALLLAFSIELPVLVLALFYLIRLCTLSKTIHSATTRKKIVLFCVCISLAIKYTDDKATASKRWCQVIDIPVNEAREAEQLVLEEIGYSLFVDINEYAQYCGNIRALAKVWNSVTNNQSPLSATNSPTCSTPMTPSVKIPGILRDIEHRISKRNAEGNHYTLVATPLSNDAFEYTPTKSRFPRFPHSIFSNDDSTE